MSKDYEKAQLGATTLKDFCESWGNDIHARILLEVLFKGLMHEEALFVLGKSQQTRNQISDNLTRGVNSDNKIDRLEESKIIPIMGEENTTDYP